MRSVRYNEDNSAIRLMDNFDEIRFSRKSFEDAFGFECMKMAYKLKLKGRMDYGPDMKSVIRL
ncbi:MAG: hypothetical protein JNL22_11475, partial [Bacteroidales bacterium]|nr:hypothetical protein [Bacteroidales bacterium]